MIKNYNAPDPDPVEVDQPADGLPHPPSTPIKP